MWGVCVCVCVSVCVCERERGSVCVCVCERASLSVSAYLSWGLEMSAASPIHHPTSLFQTHTHTRTHTHTPPTHTHTHTAHTHTHTLNQGATEVVPCRGTAHGTGVQRRWQGCTP